MWSPSLRAAGKCEGLRPAHAIAENPLFCPSAPCVCKLPLQDPMSHLAGPAASAAAVAGHPRPLAPASAAARAGRAAPLHDHAPCRARAAVRGGPGRCAACAGGDCSVMGQLQCALGGLQAKAHRLPVAASTLGTSVDPQANAAQPTWALQVKLLGGTRAFQRLTADWAAFHLSSLMCTGSPSASRKTTVATSGSGCALGW